MGSRYTAAEAAALERQALANGGTVRAIPVRGPGDWPGPCPDCGLNQGSCHCGQGTRRKVVPVKSQGRPLQGPCQSIWIPGWFPAPMNKLTTSNGHWSTTGRLKKADKDIIAAYSVYATKATGPRKVSILLILPKGKRMPDEDSLEKSVWDSLVHCGRLVNDSPKWCRRGAPPAYARALLECQPGTVILLEDL